MCGADSAFSLKLFSHLLLGLFPWLSDPLGLLALGKWFRFRFRLGLGLGGSGGTDHTDGLFGCRVDTRRLCDEIALKFFERSLSCFLIHAGHYVLSEVEDALQITR